MTCITIHRNSLYIIGEQKKRHKTRCMCLQNNTTFQFHLNRNSEYTTDKQVKKIVALFCNADI